MSSIKSLAEEKVYYFHSLAIDEQLAVLWYLYRDDIKNNITPTPERTDKNLERSEELINLVKQMSPEDQLQLQRDFFIGKNSKEFQTYKEYSSNQKLFFWYTLAVEMEQKNIVRVPSDYILPPEAQKLLDEVRELPFADRLIFLRDVVGLSSAENV